MVVIGITGNIGSGKSSVCQVLVRLGAIAIDADELAHEAYKPHSQAWREIIDTLGSSILKPDGEIDRQELGRMVFSRPDALKQLNQIVHPRAYHLAEEKIACHRRLGAKAIALEATLLIEAGWTSMVDKTWLVIAPDAAVIQRVRAKQKLERPQILARLKAQMPAEEKMKYADEVIYNDGDLKQLESRVAGLWSKLNAA